jgi:hypothetical protein
VFIERGLSLEGTIRNKKINLALDLGSIKIDNLEFCIADGDKVHEFELFNKKQGVGFRVGW